MGLVVDWLVVSSALLSAVCSTGVGMCPEQEISMKKQVLKNCIGTLKALRDAKHGELDASIVGELEVVVAQLEVCCESEGDEVTVGPLSEKALSVLGRVAESFVAEIIKAWFDID